MKPVESEKAKQLRYRCMAAHAEFLAYLRLWKEEMALTNKDLMEQKT